MLLTESDINHLIYIVEESKKKCLDSGGSLTLKAEPQAMKLSECSRIYTKLLAIKDAHDSYNQRTYKGV